MGTLPFDKREGYIWYNGEFVPWAEGTIHLGTHGLHYASCVFEGERVYNGAVFKSHEHTQRLFRSAEIMGMSIPYTLHEIEQAKTATVARQAYEHAYMRIVAWRGSEMMGVSAQKARIHCAIMVWQWPSYFSMEERMKGIKMDLARWRRPDPRTSPCLAKAAGLYMICTLARHEAEAKGFHDALMLDWQGRVAEATGANIFFVRDGELHTPVADCFLDGITRHTVMDIAKSRNIKVIERRIGQEELGDFSQCFLTGTAAEVTPVAQIGSAHYQTGDISSQMMIAYDEIVHQKHVA